MLIATQIVFSVFAAFIMVAKPVWGTDADIFQFPQQVALRYKACSECPFEHVCGGSLYNSTVVISSASCFSVDATLGNYMVVAGSSILDGADGVLTRLARIVQHEEHKANSVQNDVSIIFLSTPLPVNNGSIALAQLAEQEPAQHTAGTVSGWARVQKTGALIQKVEVKIVGEQSCQEQLTTDVLCATANSGTACQLGAGSSLLVRGELAGILSPAADCTKDTDLYANIANLKNWIERTLRGETTVATLIPTFL